VVTANIGQGEIFLQGAACLHLLQYMTANIGQGEIFLQGAACLHLLQYSYPKIKPGWIASSEAIGEVSLVQWANFAMVVRLSGKVG